MLSNAIKAGADYVGFNHFPKSPRYVELAQIGKLIKSTPENVKSVVLLVNPDNETLSAIIKLKPDFIQFHGSESATWISNALGDTDQPAIKVLPIGSKSDLEAIDPFIGLVEHILLDAKPPKSATRPGGLGETFDWSLLKGVDKNLGFFLAGGLNPDNIAKAIAQVNPLGVDVASGVESSPGIKDVKLITKFVANVKQADKDKAGNQQKI